MDAAGAGAGALKEATGGRGGEVTAPPVPPQRAHTPVETVVRVSVVVL